MAEGRPVERVQVRLDTGGSFDYLIE